MHDDVLTYVVQIEDRLVYLRDVFKYKLPLSHALLARLKVQEKIRVNGQIARTNYRLRPGDVVTVDLCLDEKNKIIPQALPLDIVYEDADLLVINKPPGLAVHPVKDRLEGTLANAVTHYWVQQGRMRVFRPINRLDQGTSGLVLVGKSQYAHQAMFKQQKQHLIRRSYQAVVEGVMEEDQGLIDQPIAHADPQSTGRRIVHPDGKPSVTHFKVLKRYQGHTLLELHLETGRTHQIRVHLNHLGHPICGDSIYGFPSPLIKRQALHAGQVSFHQPRSGSLLHLEAPLPPDMAQLLNQLIPLV